MMDRHVVDGGYVTNYNDPVVGIKPINQKSIETAMSGKIQRPVKYIEETDLYKTSARSYGAIKPRDDEIGPAIRQDSASNYRPNDTVGINRKFSRHLGELGLYRSYRNHSFSTTFDTSFYTPLYDPIGNRAILGGLGLNHYKSQSEKYLTTGPREYLYKKPNT
jgi:hypothetical protein